ncbi:hypothetical protein SO802_012227 [Lithocarpus litseifolius]|uniref:Zinc knuckle CX2CX4HX4C domain-containing protein n=1 Tax=Lithocarpus litseifolius TaxID=425828 RepID=A0AAW2D640_9ROSI
MEEITTGWKQMSLRGPEEDKFDLRSEMGSRDFILAAKFHTKRVLNLDAVARNFSQLWRTRNGFKIKDQVAEGICSGIGEVVPSDFSVMEGGDHVRVRVILDTTKPLCSGRKITLDGGSTSWASFKYERLPSICFWCGCLTHGEKDCEQWFTSEGSLTVEDRKYGAWLRAPLSNQIRKSTIAVPGFYQQNRESRVSKEEGCGPSSSSPQVPLTVMGTPLKPLEKVIPVSVPPNSAAYPSVRILDDLPPGFGGQPITKNDFSYTLHKSDAEQGKGDVMEDGVKNVKLVPSMGSDATKTALGEDSKVIQPTQPKITCESSSHIARSVSSPLADISNSLDFSMSTSVPLKSSWSRINRSTSKPEENLVVSIGKKKGVIS